MISPTVASDVQGSSSSTSAQSNALTEDPLATPPPFEHAEHKSPIRIKADKAIE